MAKIEMDVQEYDLMREKSRLLEEAVCREKELQKTIELLHQEREKDAKEKIKAYEKAKMSVAYVKKNVITEHLLTRSDVDIAYLFNSHFNLRVSSEQIDYFMQRLGDSYWSKIKSINESEDVTYRGFDEVKAELRLQLESDVQQKLNDYTKLSEQFDDLMPQKNRLEKLYEETNKELASTRDKLEEAKALSSILFDVNKVIYKVKQRISERHIFNKGIILDDISIYLNKVKLNTIICQI